MQPPQKYSMKVNLYSDYARDVTMFQKKVNLSQVCNNSYNRGKKKRHSSMDSEYQQSKTQDMG